MDNPIVKYLTVVFATGIISLVMVLVIKVTMDAVPELTTFFLEIVSSVWGFLTPWQRSLMFIIWGVLLIVAIDR